MFSLRSCSGVYVAIRNDILLQFDENSPCDRISLFLPYQTLQNLFLRYVKVI
ncbi:hypothetical protein Hanom_Chr14g01257901 [Helianthus anomalus]